MTKTRKPIDTVRASRDGHEFHENWAARKSLQLIMPRDGLIGIAVEGLSPQDQNTATKEAVEIADLTLYYGKDATYERAKKVQILQFKYSIGKETVPFRYNDAKKTVAKFAKAYKAYIKKYGIESVREKLEFAIITNRPIHANFQLAIEGIAANSCLSGDTMKQASQIKATCRMADKKLADFAKALTLTGLAGNLRANKADLCQFLVNWSGSHGPLSRARLGGLRQLLREKAGFAGQGRNVIKKVDVLDILEIGEEDFFPCPATFAKIGPIVERDQLTEAIQVVSNAEKPIVIHASGGMGKTVFLQSIATALKNEHEVFIFDCFGGGAYRSPEDGRHRPQRGLAHIANIFASRGLCDPLFPSGSSNDELLRAFRGRLKQCVETLRNASPKRCVFLFIDAADNAAEFANEQGEPCFPALLLQSFMFGGNIPGVHLIFSCRTERRNLVKNDLDCPEYQLKPFFEKETEFFLAGRVKNLKKVEVQVAQSRSGGNPRILEHLVAGGRGLLEPSEVNKTIKLDEILEDRIQRALGDAKRQGHSEAEIISFLAGLAVLPPPVPVADFALAQQMETSAIDSFSVDLAPMLERTKHGIWFRDEPTETLIRKKYGQNTAALRIVADNLLSQQGKSVYAARALPRLLQILGAEQNLFDLAFSEAFPCSLHSSVGKRTIRDARLKVAIVYAAKKKNYNHLIRLVVELSTIEAGNEKGIRYILDNPDLIAACQDVDSTRRLFETRTSWQGTRHARLAIVHLLQNELSDAVRYIVQADEWIRHYIDQRERDFHRPGPTTMDTSAVALCLIAQCRYQDAASYMRKWKDWYAYDLAIDVFSILVTSSAVDSVPGLNALNFIGALSVEIGPLTAAIAFPGISAKTASDLAEKLARACREKKRLDSHDRSFGQRETIEDGLLKAAGVALSLGLKAQVLDICNAITPRRPNLSAIIDRHGNPYSRQYICPFIFHRLLQVLAEGRKISAQDILPSELHEIWPIQDLTTEDAAFKAKVKARFKEVAEQEAQKEPDVRKRKFSASLGDETDRFLEGRLKYYLELIRALGDLLLCPIGMADQFLVALTKVWGQVRQNRDRYIAEEFDALFDAFGQSVLQFALSVRSDVTANALSPLLAELEKGQVSTSTLIEFVSILGKRPPLHETAGKIAKRAGIKIEENDEVGFRANLYASLSRAILPVSKEDAIKFFREGLEQMDIVGSGDYEFINGLVAFGSSIDGQTLREKAFHTFTNMCELNIYEVDKFDWNGFGNALARLAGLPGIAKLFRWDDRSKVSLSYSLMPFLTVLVNDSKIDPDLALCLLRLCDPLEMREEGFSNFAAAILGHPTSRRKLLATELLRQFKANEPSLVPSHRMANLIPIFEAALGADANQIKVLRDLEKASNVMNRQRDDNYNHSHKSASAVDYDPAWQTEDPALQAKAEIDRILAEFKQNGMQRLPEAIESFIQIPSAHAHKRAFFGGLRETVQFDARSQYLRAIAGHETLNYYWKLDELQHCRENWDSSSSSIGDVFKALADSLLTLHAEDLIGHSYLSVSELKRMSKILGVELDDLIISLITRFSSSDVHVSGTIWMQLASMICRRAENGEPQAALTRLLDGSATKLSSKVADGAWKPGTYPSGNQVEITAAAIWFKLGAPAAADRWRAAHSVISLATMGRWDVIAILISKINTSDAGPFQAPELKFYFLHSRLWLLIALARIAMDFPRETSVHIDVVKSIAFDETFPHPLIRHFAARILEVCHHRKGVKLNPREKALIAAVNKSVFPAVKQKKGKHWGDPWFGGRPAGTHEPANTFNLEYEFRKGSVNSLCRIFGKEGWEIDDLITTWVRKFDPDIKAMYETGGRERPGRRDTWGMTAKFHIYGEYLGWHGHFLAAGTLLSQWPVVDDRGERPWEDWLLGELLTRQDGLWLADGTDSPPLSTLVNLLEQQVEGLGITGDREKILGLIEISSGAVHEKIVVEGHWNSFDGIDVSISSALVPAGHGEQLAIKLSKENPFHIWLPDYQESGSGSEYIRHRDVKDDCEAWIVSPDVTGRLDDQDPLGSAQAVIRPYFCENIRNLFGLKATDEFNRGWKGRDGKVCCSAEAWGRGPHQEAENIPYGNRLRCSNEFLQNVLREKNMELLLAIKLQRYQQGGSYEKSSFHNTLAIVRITSAMECFYHEGCINKLH